MEEGSGSILSDETDNHLSLMLFGNPLPLWSTDVPPTNASTARSLFFDGGNFGQLFDSSNSALFDFTLGFTVDGWVKPVSAPPLAFEQGIVGKRTGLEGWALILPGTKAIHAINNSSLISISAISDGKWHYVAITWNGGTQSIYIDGNFEGSLPNSIQPKSSGKTFYLASYAPPNNNFMGGLDDFRMYNYARTLSEINADAQIIPTPTVTITPTLPPGVTIFPTFTPTPTATPTPTPVPVCSLGTCCKLSWCGAESSVLGGAFCGSNRRCQFDSVANHFVCAFDPICP